MERTEVTVCRQEQSLSFYDERKGEENSARLGDVSVKGRGSEPNKVPEKE